MGAISLMLDEGFIRGSKSRIRIFHCKDGKKENYAVLLKALPKLDKAVAHIEMFMPEKKAETIRVLEAIGFAYHRTSYVMTRMNKEKLQATWPIGYSVRDFVLGQDEVAYADIRNQALETFLGNSTPITVGEVKKHVTAKDVLPGGVKTAAAWRKADWAWCA